MWPIGVQRGFVAYDRSHCFTGDEDFLKDIAYPLLADVVALYQCYTSEEFNVTGPSLSPEKDFIVPDDFTDAGLKGGSQYWPYHGRSIDSFLLVFNNVIEAGEILGIDDDVVSAYITSRNGGDSQLRYVNGS